MAKKIYCISAGHNPAGKIACGASDFLDESTEARKITKEVIKLLRKNGCKVYNCTTNKGTSQNDVLRRIVSYHNEHPDAEINISIHFNSGRNDKKGDNSIAGTEVWCYEVSGTKKEVANRFLANMQVLGFKNRGIKDGKNLYFCNKTIGKAILLEVCFVDDKDDYLLYKEVGYKKVAQAIVNAILYK